MSQKPIVDNVDLTGGLDPQREYALIGEKPDKYRFAENYMLAVYDPVLDLGMWLHLGTCPDDFTQWEEQVLIALPGNEGFLWTRGYSRPKNEIKPGGANLFFEIVDPFVKSHVRFDGIGVRTPYEEMMADRVRDGQQELFALDLTINSLAPAWDNHVSATSSSGRGSLEDQSWASEHYQQALQAVGTVRINGKDLAFNGTGTRDHSRGQRGHKTSEFGGHNLWVAPFPSGKAFGMQRMWKPDGTPTLDVGFVFIDGQFMHCDLLSPPGYLEKISLSGDPIELVMGSSLGEHRITGTIRKSTFVTFNSPWGYFFGVDQNDPRGIFSQGFCEFNWDGETGYGLAERSGQVGVVPGK